MRQKIFYSIFLTVILAVVISTVLTVNYFILAWSEPTADPPGGTSGIVLGRWSAGTTPGEIYYNDGNVGIGTANPAAKLHIYDPGNWNAVELDARGTAAVDQVGLSFITLGDGQSSLSTAGAEGWLLVGRGNAYSLAEQQSDFGLYFWDGTVWLERMFVEYDTGNVGIGETSPSQKLDVLGAVQLGTSALGEEGVIRWTGTDFEGYDGSNWISLTSGGSIDAVTYDFDDCYNQSVTLSTSYTLCNPGYAVVGMNFIASATWWPIANLRCCKLKVQ